MAVSFRGRCILLVIAPLCFVQPVRSQTYNYQVIARTGQSLGGLTLQRFDQPSLNDSGQVAFTATTTSGDILVARDATVIAKTGDAIGGSLLSGIWAGPWINASGQVAFTASRILPSGVHIGNGIFVDNHLRATIGGSPPPVLLNNGTVFFQAGCCLYLSTNPASTQITYIADGWSGRMNQTGQIVYISPDETRVATIGLSGASYGPGSVICLLYTSDAADE